MCFQHGVKNTRIYIFASMEKYCFSVFVIVGNTTNSAWWHCVTVERSLIRSFHSIHNIVDRGVLQAMWEELTGKVVHRDKLADLSADHVCLKTLCRITSHMQ